MNEHEDDYAPEYEPPDDGPDYEATAAAYLPDTEPLF